VGLGLALIVAAQSAGAPPLADAVQANPVYWAAWSLQTGVPYVAYALAGAQYVRAVPGPWKPSTVDGLSGGGVTGLTTGAIGGLVLAALSMLANWLTYLIAQQEPVADIVFLGGGMAIIVGVIARAVTGAIVGGVAGALTAVVLARRG
jgi:hypothetical protein